MEQQHVQEAMKFNNNNNFGDPRSEELARQVAALKEKLISVVARERHKDSRLKQVEERYERDLTSCKAKAQQQISSLLEELRVKERKIAEFQHNFNTQRGCAKSKSVTPSDEEFRGSVLQVISENRQNVGEKLGEIKPDTDAIMMSTLFGPSSRSKSYGGIQTMFKEEHEREKQRWQMKLSEVEEQLRKSEEANAEFLQNKAELNKKIVELEKNQKPLLENNKRLSDKNKHLLQETKKMEEKVRHAQEDYLILKDSYDRLLSEYSKIKDKRITPEKLDDLERYKQQNLEYGKCINALKQAALEKDRKLELLHQKLRRIKKARGSSSVDQDDDAASFVSSECSLSSISLDTITEDCEEIEREELESNYCRLSKEHLELQRAFSALRNVSVSNSDYGEVRQRERQLQGQVQQLRSKASELEKSLSVATAFGGDVAWAQEKLSLTSRIHRKIEELEKCQEDLTVELDDFREQNELLEFQVLEMQQSQEEVSDESESSAGQIRTRKAQSVCDRSVSTSDDEAVYSMDQSDSSSGDESVLKELPPDELKIRFTLLKHRRGLRPEDKAVVCQVKEWLETLQSQHAQCLNKEMEWELKLRESEGLFQEEIRRLESEKEALSMKRVEMKSVQTETVAMKEENTKLSDDREERLKLSEDLVECRKQCEKLRVLLRSSQDEEQRQREMEQKLRKQLSEIGDSRRAEIEFMERNSRQHAESLAKLRDELEKVRDAHDVLAEENKTLKEEKEVENKRLVSTPSCHQPNDTMTAVTAATTSSLSHSAEDKAGAEALTKKKLEELEIRQDLKKRFKESVTIIREYEKTDKQYRFKLRSTQIEVEKLKGIIHKLRDTFKITFEDL